MIFVSDLHFGLPLDAHERHRRGSFLRFLDSLHGVDRLIINGDLFQFWFDMGSTMPTGYFDILTGLSMLRERGTRIDYLAGNHDWWLGDFWERELGVTTHPGDLEISAQGRRILVQHGDGVGPGDHGYKFLKRILRHRATLALARALHPDLLHRLARRMDRLSHAHTAEQPVDTQRLRAAARLAFAQGYDTLILGHVHAQVHEKIDDGQLLVIGDWLTLHSYIKFESGQLTGLRWEAK